MTPAFPSISPTALRRTCAGKSRRAPRSSTGEVQHAVHGTPPAQHGRRRCMAKRARGPKVAPVRWGASDRAASRASRTSRSRRRPDVVVVAECDTALEALADLGRVVLEPAQPAIVRLSATTAPSRMQPRLGVAADETAATIQPAMLPKLRRAEHLADPPPRRARPLRNSGLSMPLSAASISSMAW